MTDFLDGELGEFDWGPATRRLRLPRRVRIDTLRPLIHALMAGVGAMALTFGLIAAWTSYTASVGAAPPPAASPASHPEAIAVPHAQLEADP